MVKRVCYYSVRFSPFLELKSYNRKIIGKVHVASSFIKRSSYKVYFVMPTQLKLKRKKKEKGKLDILQPTLDPIEMN